MARQTFTVVVDPIKGVRKFVTVGDQLVRLVEWNPEGGTLTVEVDVPWYKSLWRLLAGGSPDIQVRVGRLG